jgi:sugar O-acyltransferase (sialic acid O-acetyltransferase NeuD family)
MLDLVLIGAGGHGREVLDVVDAINAQRPTYRVVGFLDDGDPDPGLIEGRGYSILGPSTEAPAIGVAFVLSLGSSRDRKAIDGRLRATGLESPVLVHPHATIGPDVELGPGCVVTAGVRFGNHIRVGRHGHVNMNSTVHHDCVLEDYVTLSPGVHLNGNVVVREGAFFGTAATVIPGHEIGAWATIGAGAVVVRDVAAGVTAVGVPAHS